MCNAYHITITAGMRQAFFDKFEISFIFLKKRLDIVLFLYFYHLTYICALFYCYFFIIIIVNFSAFILLPPFLHLFLDKKSYLDRTSNSTFPLIPFPQHSRGIKLFIYHSIKYILRKAFLNLRYNCSIYPPFFYHIF